MRKWMSFDANGSEAESLAFNDGYGRAAKGVEQGGAGREPESGGIIPHQMG
jgi:hypothetical protein